MHLVEDHQPVAVKGRIVLQSPGQHAFGDHLDTCARSDMALVAGLVANRLADGFVQQRGHPLRSGAGGEPARLEHDDALTIHPGFVDQHQRSEGRLASARWGDEDGRTMVCQR